MRKPKFLVLIMLACLIGIPALISEALANQKMASIVRYKDMNNSLSQHELTLHEFLSEREQLMRNRSAENPRILKNKLKILNSKIEFLQKEIRRSKPYMVRQRLVASDPSLVPTPTPVAAAASVPAVSVPAPAPVEVESQSAPRETPADAMIQVIPQKLMPRETPAGASMTPSSPAPKRFLDSALRGGAEMRTVETEFRMEWPSASREAAVELPSPPKKIEFQPAGKPALRAEALGAKSIAAGIDWKQMTLADKEIYILSLMGNLSRRDVYLMKPYSYYIQSIDRALEADPKLDQEPVHKILMTAAYDSEPDSRKDLEKVFTA